MAENSAIEWCDHTFNPWEGCQKVGPGCDHCYAEARNARFGGGVAPNWGPGAPRRRTSEANWRKPLAWNAAAARAGTRPRVFCASLADVFDNAVPPDWRSDLFELIRATPHLDWLLLTKRIGNVQRMLADDAETDRTPDNVWLGATIINQAEADRDIPRLLAVPARVRFLSMEPLLGPVDFQKNLGGTRWVGGQRGCAGSKARSGAFHHGVGSPDCPRHLHHHHDDRCKPGLDWIIVGGESGLGARPMHPDWARSLRDQCVAAEVPFLFKQWGEFSPLAGARPVLGPPAPAAWPDGSVGVGRAIERGGPGICLYRATKKIAGRLLDGVQHDGTPG